MSSEIEDSDARPLSERPEPIAYSTQTPGSVDLAVIIFRVLGIYSMLQVLPDLLSLYRFDLLALASLPRIAGVVAMAILPGILLIVCSSWLARLTAGGERQAFVKLPASGAEWQAIAFSVIGLLIFSNGLTSFAYAVTAMIRISRQPFAPRPDYTQVVAPLLQIVIGGALFLRAKGLAILWHHIRYTPPTPTGDAESTRPKED